MKAKEFRESINTIISELIYKCPYSEEERYTGVCIATISVLCDNRGLKIRKLFWEIMGPPKGHWAYNRSFWLGKPCKKNVSLRETALRIFEEEIIRTGKHRSL